MTELRWQDVKVDSIWYENRRSRDHRLVIVHRVEPPEGPKDLRLVSVMIRTVVLLDGKYVPKRGSRLSWTTVDRLGRDFELLFQLPGRGASA